MVQHLKKASAKPVQHLKKSPAVGQEAPQPYGDVYPTYCADAATNEKAASDGFWTASYVNSKTGQKTPTSPLVGGGRIHVGETVWGLNDPTIYVLLDAQGTVRTVVSREREAKLWKLAGGTYVTSVLNVEL